MHTLVILFRWPDLLHQKQHLIGLSRTCLWVNLQRKEERTIGPCYQFAFALYDFSDDLSMFLLCENKSRRVFTPLFQCEEDDAD